MAAALELLEALAETPPKAFLQRQSGGQSTLRELHAQAAQAGLCPAAANDDIARLHALFDVALDHGMGGIVSDYIAEVRPIAAAMPAAAAAAQNRRRMPAALPPTACLAPQPVPAGRCAPTAC